MKKIVDTKDAKFWKWVADTRAKHVKVKSNDDDDEDDSWLDDEQWYCENLAQWSNKIKVHGYISPAELEKLFADIKNKK